MLLSFFILFSISRIQYYRMTPASVVLSMTRRAGRGLFLFFRSSCTLYTYCGASLHLKIWRASRRGEDEEQHTTKTFPLSRSDVRTIEETFVAEICWRWTPTDCRRLRGVWARRAQISIPAGTGRRGQTAFQVYIYVFILVPVRDSCY